MKENYGFLVKFNGFSFLSICHLFEIPFCTTKIAVVNCINILQEFNFVRRSILIRQHFYLFSSHLSGKAIPFLVPRCQYELLPVSIIQSSKEPCPNVIYNCPKWRHCIKNLSLAAPFRPLSLLAHVDSNKLVLAQEIAILVKNGRGSLEIYAKLEQNPKESCVKFHTPSLRQEWI